MIIGQVSPWKGLMDHQKPHSVNGYQGIQEWHLDLGPVKAAGGRQRCGAPGGEAPLQRAGRAGLPARLLLHCIPRRNRVCSPS